MVFLNVATRRVWISPATRNPTEVWVEEQAKAFIEYAKANDLTVDLVTRDNDQIYKKGFDRVMTEAGCRSKAAGTSVAKLECLCRAVYSIHPGRVPGPLSRLWREALRLSGAGVCRALSHRAAASGISQSACYRRAAPCPARRRNCVSYSAGWATRSITTAPLPSYWLCSCQGISGLIPSN